MNGPQQLHDAGVSIWLDTVSRELLASGAFATLIADQAVTEATSNSTIFAKAITGSLRRELIAPDLVNTMPEAALHAFADHGEIARVLSESTPAAEEVLHASYHELIDRIKTKTGGSVVATERPDVLR
jgi:transaldolase